VDMQYFIYLNTGLMQSSGWPTIVAIMGNWFGKGRCVCFDLSCSMYSVYAR